MAFTVTSASIDLKAGTAMLVATDHSTIGVAVNVIEIHFPFQANGDELQRATAQAKTVLQQAINEL